MAWGGARHSLHRGVGIPELGRSIKFLEQVTTHNGRSVWGCDLSEMRFVSNLNVSHQIGMWKMRDAPCDLLHEGAPVC